MFPEFSIGPAAQAERISFVSPGSAFKLQAWTPNETPVEDQVASSSAADYDRLVGYRYKTAEETFIVAVDGRCADDVANRMNELRVIIKAARDYWVDRYNNEPIYLRVRSTNETQARYALIHAGSVPTDPPPFDWPFASPKPSAFDVTVILRRGPWLDLPPQTGSSVLLSAVETYDGRNLGNVDDAGVRQPVGYQYVANKHNVANLTHIFIETIGVFSPHNWMDRPLPYDLFHPAATWPTSNTYFGIEAEIGSVPIADSGPFCSLVFDIGTPASNYLDMIWAYWDRFVGWQTLHAAAFVFQDNTDQAGAMTGHSFDTAGVNSIHWRQPPNWGPNTVNFVTAWWIMCAPRPQATPPPIVPPTQQNRDVYTITWAYAEVQADVIGGNLPAMLRYTADGVAARASWVYDDLQAQELWVGLRDVGRGVNFAAYLNASDDQHPPGVDAGRVSVRSAFADSMSAATGEMIDYTMSLVIEEEAFFWSLDYTVFPEYFGTFHCFLRGMQTAGASGAIRLRIGSRINFFGAIYYTPWARFEVIGHDHQVLDMGRLQIPNGPLTTDDVAEGRVSVYVDVIDIATTPHVYIYDLILIPADEWIGYFTAKDLENADFSYIGYERFLDVDSIMNQKVPIRALLFDEEYGFHNVEAVQEVYRADINSSYAFLTPTNRQRLWFLARKTQHIGAPTNKRADPEFATLGKAYATQVYNTMRGTG